MACDPMPTTYGPGRPPVLLARELSKRGFNVLVAAPLVAKEVAAVLASCGVDVVGRVKNPRGSSDSLTWLQEWLSEAVMPSKARSFGLEHANVNMSNTVLIRADIWYAQGPPSRALSAIWPQMPFSYRLAYISLAPLLKALDIRLSRRMGRLSGVVIANSRFCAELYESLGVGVEGFIYPPLDCDVFRPSTTSPSEDYVVTYFGKEADFTLIKAVADRGVFVKAFGFKLRQIVPNSLLKHPNVEVLRRLTDEELCDLYSNALFTLFASTHEPFGYVAIESMACGTPVLVYGREGPGETVLDGITGWHARDRREILSKAIRIWRDGYDERMRKACRARALEFDVSNIINSWLKLFNDLEVL